MDDEEAFLSERGDDGRPDVFCRPISPTLANVAGRARERMPYRDRLLLALRRAHGRPRYDLPPELSHGR
jgi:hypothetical protein